MPADTLTFLKDWPTNQGENLEDLSRQNPVLVVFLRHGGCPFCRETLAKLQQDRSDIEEVGTQIVLVHLMSDEEAARLFAQYKLDDVPRISDPAQELYRAFGLKAGSVAQVMGPRIWWAGFKATILGRHLPGKPAGNIFQLPGTFLLDNGEIVRRFVAEDSSQSPDFCEFACSPKQAGKATSSSPE